MGVRQLPEDLPTWHVSILLWKIVSNCVPGGTAAGNEAIQECSKGSYCCDANRPEIGCCQTSNDFFSLPDGTVVASIGADGPGGPRAAQSSLTTALPSATTAGRSVAADFPLSATVAQTSLSPSATPPSSTGATAVSSIDSPSEKGTAEATTSRPVPVSSVILITSVVIDSAGVSFTSITTQIVEAQIAPSSSSLPSTHGSSASTSGLKIGLGVGIPVGVILLVLLGFFLLRRRSKNRRRLPTSMENPRMNGSNPMEYMYKGHGDADSPLTATTTSPDLNHRASSKYVVSDTGEGGYRGVKTGSHSGLGLQPGPSVFPNSPTRSELSGNPSAPRDYRNSQMSELAASSNHPSELPDRPYR